MSGFKGVVNIGKVLEEELLRAGISGYQELVECGSIEALFRIRDNTNNNKGCLNMLYALEGAIQGVRWHDLSKNDKKRIKDEYERALRK